MLIKVGILGLFKLSQVIVILESHDFILEGLVILDKLDHFVVHNLLKTLLDDSIPLNMFHESRGVLWICVGL